MQTNWQYATITNNSHGKPVSAQAALTFIDLQASKSRIGKLEVDNTSLTAEVSDLKKFYMWEMEKLQEVIFSFLQHFWKKHTRIS